MKKTVMKKTKVIPEETYEWNKDLKYILIKCIFLIF